MKNVAKILTLFILATTIPNQLFSQATVISITDGNASTCNGILYDSGGVGGSGYQNNESFTLVICPDTPGDAITLDFLNFALSTTNTATPPANNADNLSIYDGNSTAAPTLGTYTGNQLQGLIVSCTSLNTTGCITLVFNSNDAGTGVFAANITCSTPCQRPTVVMDNPIVPNNPVRICDGEQVSFDGSSSFAAAGFNIVQYIWNFDDGTIDTTSGATATHNFSAPTGGDFSVNLYVIDDNNCISTNLETIKVLVSTVPSFATITPDTTLCLGEDVTLGGATNVTPTTYTGQPISSLGGTTYLPDDVGQCFSADLTFQDFTPGQTVSAATDLVDICVNMEHSYMGDLVASIYCPNGQSVVLYQQNGGGTNLGDPNQLDDSTLIGDCWQYCWSPTATNGTWEDNSQFGATPNTVVNSSGSQSLAPGTYESLNPLSNLIGCPLNGTWTIEFCDLWGADDGFVCDWSMQFQPSLYPSVTTFTPIPGNDSDSSFWTAGNPASTFITNTSADANIIDITPTQTGAFDYTYQATNNFGCTFDTTITVTVGNGPTVDLGPDLVACNNGSVALNATATGGIASSPTCSYTIQMEDTFGDGWNGFTIEVYINGALQGTHTLNTGGNGNSTFPIADGDMLSFNTISGVFDTEVSYSVLDCDGNVLYQTGANYSGGAPTIGANVWNGVAVSNVAQQYQYNWTPATGLSATNVFNPTATITGPTTYVVEAWETNHQVCSDFDTILVTLAPSVFAGVDSTLSICFNDSSIDLTSYLGTGIDTVAAYWEDPTNALTDAIFTPSIDSGGVYSYIVPNLGNCPNDTAQLTVTVLQLGDPLCGCPLSPTVAFNNPTCYGYCDGDIEITDPFGAEYSIDNGTTWQPLNTFNALCNGNYNVLVQNPIYGNDCIDTTIINIVQPDAVQPYSQSTDVSCFEYNDGLINTVVFGNSGPYSIYVIDSLGTANSDTISSTNSVSGASNPLFNLIAGNYQITTVDAAGCSYDTTITITEPIDFVVSTIGDTSVNVEDPIELFATGGVSYEWTPPSGLSCTDCPNPTATPLNNTTYYVEIIDTNGCSKIEQLNVTVTYGLIFVPTGFSPNADGLNDELFVRGKGITDFNFSIYDRWGKVVFLTKNQNEGWDGTYEGKDMNMGVFVYRLNATLGNGEIVEQTGNITLFR